MASTYESPETVVISEAGPTVAALKGVSDAFSTGLKKYGEMRNAEAAANKKRQAELAKAVYIDPEKYFERIQKNEGSAALQNQALELFRKNTELSLEVRSGIGGTEVLQKRNQTIKKLNQLVGYAEAETTFKENWIANGDERIKNMSNQGGASALDEQFWSAANILSGLEDGKVETTYVNGAQYYTFTGKELEKPYKVPSVAFLSKELPKVPQWDKSVKDALIQIGLIDDDGKLTMDARKMTKEKYYENAREAVTKVAAGFAKKDLHSVNSIVVDVMGEKDQYPEGRATGQISPEFEGSVINKDYQKKFKNSTGDYSMANNIPQWYGIDPKPIPAREKALNRKIAKYKKDSNTWKETFEEKKSLFGFGKNPKGGSYTGSIDMFKDTQEKDENGNLVNVLEPNFIKALSEIGPGYRVVSTTGGSGGTEVTVSRTNNKGGTVTFVEGSTAQNFIDKLYNYEFEGDEGYGPEQAKAFANQFIKDGGIKPQLPN